ncbi:hypothetical protein B0J13DRAFT_152717 [Dactylonectria estremocensis]|uniref:Xylanolytic transcriptional activator regulatory domain-containing protein n=1 Tax=Dactylonectria estremocensis TaxID=1079267 RepID=A0A9P9DQS4_9HYPO|nr:hypothetical protein B0J13DRAFT_152717 [Dactylonectria estremocensis]
MEETPMAPIAQQELSYCLTELPDIGMLPQSSQPDIPTRREMLGAFFTHVHGNPYIFVHETTLRRQFLNFQVSDAFLYSLCALCTCHMANNDRNTSNRQTEEYLQMSESGEGSLSLSLETMQINIMQILCLLYLGHGARAWMKLGSAIRIVQGMQLHKESSRNTETTTYQDSVRLCIHTLYSMDRFSVCGTSRPMMFNDDTLRDFRLPTPDGVFGETTVNTSWATKFSELLSYDNSKTQQQTIMHMFTSICVLLGKCNNYLQSGGVQGDSHFPWHPMSNLSGLVGQLRKWKDRVESAIAPASLDCSQTTTVNRFYLSWFIYHTIFVRLYRQFLPLITGSAVSDDSSDPWQQETSRKCVEHAVAISELCVQAQMHGYSWPYFTSFCLGSAGTVLIHATHYELAIDHRPYLLNIVERILDMRDRNVLVDYQCEMLRQMHRVHAAMIRNYRSGTLVTTNLHLTQFYKRYPEGLFDPSHIPFSRIGDWMDTSLDGPDDLFSLGSLSQRLVSMRGQPYMYHKQLTESESSAKSAQSPLGTQSIASGSFSEASRNYPSSLMYALDGYFEFEASSTASQAMSGHAQNEPCESIRQGLIDSVLQQVAEDGFRGLEY